MPNPTVLTTFASPDPSATVQTVQQLVDLLNALVATAIQGSYIPYVIGSTTPAVGDQDKAWIRVDGSGRPIGTYVFYGGSWRRSPTGNKYEIRMFNGNPATYFDTSGLGLQSPDDWDGWAIANGGNGTVNLSNLFIVGGDMNNGAIPPLVSGYAGGAWNSVVTGNTLANGGSKDYLLQNTNLPYTKVQLTGYTYQASANTGDPQPIITADHGNTVHTLTISEIGANPSATPPIVQVAVPTIPPFYSMAFCQWVGYA